MEQQPAAGKESRESSERYSFAPSHISDTESVKAFKAKEYFKKVQNSSRRRQKMYRDILMQQYADFFVDGFSLKGFDQKLAHLDPDDKAQMIEHILGALDVDLRLYRSTTRDSKGALMNPGRPGEQAAEGNLRQPTNTTNA